MFTYALTLPIWTNRDNAWPHWDDFWLHLLGFDHPTVTLWRDEDQPIISEMTDCYEKWVPDNLPDRSIARAFLIFLNRSAARPLRAPAVRWLLAFARTADECWRDRGELTKLMAEFLDKLWLDKSEAINQSKDFRELVAVLARRQNPLAMDLQERLAIQP